MTFITKNRLFLFCLAIIILQFLQLLYFNRYLFLQEYNVSYWKDRMEHSQWTLPLSQRIIGDDGIYSYAGYRMMQGDSIETTNANKPPVGIYLIGISIILLHNPIYFAFLTGIGTIVAFYFFAKALLKNKKIALMTTTLLVVEPFVYTHFTTTTLDLLQLLFLLINFLFLFYAVTDTNHKIRYLWIGISGLSLGFFTETKPPLLVPVILCLELVYLFYKKRFIFIIVFLATFVVGVFIPYFRYFAMGHTILDYLKLHKYMASVYYNGKNQLFRLSVWDAILIGYFPDVVTGAFQKIREWWIFLPIVTVAGIGVAVKTLITRKKDIFLKGICVFLLVTLLIYTNIPFYVRYTILFVPILYLLFAQAFKKYLLRPVGLVLFVIVACGGLFYTTWLLVTTQPFTIQDYYYNFSHQYFHDIYAEDISQTSKNGLTQEQFRKIAQNALINATVKNITVSEKKRTIPLFGNHGSVQFHVIYKTQDLGAFSEDKTMNLVNENGQWKIVWDWDLLLHKFTPGTTFTYTSQVGKRGTLYSPTGQKIVQDTNGYLISINPNKIDTKRENEMLSVLAQVILGITNDSRNSYLQNVYLENVIPDTFVPIGTTFLPLTPELKAKLQTFPGLQLSTTISRIYDPASSISSGALKNTFYDECCSKIYSSTTYHAVEGIEQKYDAKLSGSNGGSMVMKKDGIPTRVLVSHTARTGEDITLPVSNSDQ